MPPAGAMRHGLIEGVLGAVVAMAVITVAHASLPELGQTAAKSPPPRRAAAPVIAPPAPAPAPVLIAFREPLADGEVGSPFGLRQLPWEAHARLHAGLDLEAPAPEPILASADGVVTRVGQDAGYGRFVELTHAEGLVTLYGHLERFAPGIAQGAAVKAGTPLGRIGSTGSSTGVHLHFEVHDREGRPLNPELLLGHAFATAEEIPLTAARRVPRTVRVAFVSRIPRSKRALMEERADEAEARQEVAQLRVRGRVLSVIRPAGQATPPPPVLPLAPAPQSQAAFEN